MTTTIDSERTTSVTVTRLVTYGVLAAVTATVVNALVRLVAIMLLDVPRGFAPLGWGPVINTTVAGVLGATVVYGLLTRISKYPDRGFLRIALVVLLLSFIPLIVPPAFLAAAPWPVLGTLAVMHVTTTVTAVSFLLRAADTGVSS
ncbi:DUF6069 family protein [Haladaptatus salinisoli]|uniref:DUF6069 family protein n=1 Tax=Haladaptatus salinisoli TaxID=2884876 RepID=UPI001D0A1613|nr:DUF6069 family protein [Haladaptatus salinisoli]